MAAIHVLAWHPAGVRKPPEKEPADLLGCERGWPVPCMLRRVHCRADDFANSAGGPGARSRLSADSEGLRRA